MNPVELRERRRYLHEQRKAWTDKLSQMPKGEWPPFRKGIPYPAEVWRSKWFLVQVFNESSHIRLSISRNELDENGGWKEGISWDELMQLKRECGHAESDAVEVYPADSDIVNVANMRHLWIPEQPLSFKWKSQPRPAP